MALPADYITGTITLTNASNAFTGTGTGWQAADFREGDIILGIQDNAGVVYVVASITSNTAGTLTQPWAGPTGTYSYRMRYEWDSSRVSAQTRTLIELLGNGNLQAIAGLDGSGGDKLPYFTGSGAADTTPLSPFARTLLDDEDAAAARATIGAGNITGPTDSVDGDIAIYLGTSGRFLVGAGATIADLRNASGLNAGTIPDARISASLTPDKAFRRGNILGTVSQSAGVPTGGIIERGSNANGSYIRFADGTLICWGISPTSQTTTTADGPFFRTPSPVFLPFPVAFSQTPSAVPYADKSSLATGGFLFAALSGSSPSTIGVAMYLVGTFNAAVGFPAYIAIGRWF